MRQRLASAKPGAHPDADLLTAFAEQALSARERDSILQHLSQCSGCREVLFLAAPQVQLETDVVRVRSRWLGSPVLRWGAIAACAVVVVAAVSLKQRSERAEPLSATLPQVAAKLDVPAVSQKMEAAAVDKDRAAMEYKSRADVARSDEKVFRTPNNAPKARAAQPAPARSQFGAVAGAAIGGSAIARDEAFAKPVAPASPSSQVNEPVAVTAESAAVVPGDSMEANPGKAKQAVQGNQPAANNAARLEAAPAAAVGGVQALFKKITPRWTLSADGSLQRSTDGGKTWKTIPVAADATLAAVAAMDSNIWVGGSHGALYHSTDAGDHWTQVVLTSDGQSLDSNVIGIEFTDSLHGKITTADQQIWTTSDGGQSWRVSH